VKDNLERIRYESIKKIKYKQIILLQEAREKNEYIKKLNKCINDINKEYEELTETPYAKMTMMVKDIFHGKDGLLNLVSKYGMILIELWEDGEITYRGDQRGGRTVN
jgi:hypothetical protein